jgi:hypothetical protein
VRSAVTIIDTMLSRFWTRVQRRTDGIAAVLEKRWPLCVILFAEIYVVITALHAMRRFWYDELFTFYICRLPSMSVIWSALKEGADLNPPLFYIATRAFQAAFGNSELVTRLPAILGFLVMSLCIFHYVSRYGSRLAALAAMTFPLITGAYYYASEARAYGMVLAFGGLAAVFWQSAARDERRKIALPALAAALTGALLSHCYAVLIFVPFALAELARSISRRRLDWPMLACFALPCPTVLLYLPMFAATRGDVFNNPIYRPEWGSIPDCYVTHFGAALWPVLAGLVILALVRPRPEAPEGSSGDKPSSAVPAHEIVLAVGFALVPVFGVLLAMTVTGVFMDRYGVTALIGCSILIGALIAQRQSRAAAVSVLFIFIGTFALNSAMWIGGPMMKPKPSKTIPRPPFVLSELAQDLPIVITNGLLFLEYDHYEAKAVTDQLYFLTDVANAVQYTGTGTFDRVFYTLQKWFPIRAHIGDYRDFLATHSHFLVLAEYDFPMDWVMRKMLDDHVVLTFKGEFPLQHGNAILVEVSRPAQAQR